MSGKRAIYFAPKYQFHQSLINHLNYKYKWEPIFIASYGVSSFAKDNYPHSIFVDSMKLRQAQFDYRDLGKPIPIDSDLIDVLSKYEKSFLSLMEDTTGWNYSFLERKSFYFNMLRYWNTVILKLKPDLFINFNWPHTPPCYSLYLMCKFYYSIDVLFLDPIPLLNLNYNLIGSSLEELYLPIMKVYTSEKTIEPSSGLTKYLNDVRSPQGLVPKHIVNDYLRSKKLSNLFRIKQFARLFASTIIKGNGFMKAKVAWKKNKDPYYYSSSQMNNLEYFLFVESLRRKNKKLYKIYHSLCVYPDFNKKYIYFAATYQPEATTRPNGGVYEDLFLALDIISSIIPEDWIIYYKEHLYTFKDPLGKGNLMRNKYFFDRIKCYKNIKLVSTDISTFKLIDHSQAVSSVAGTVAWEAVVRGKPAMSFGSAWYMGCKSIFKINTLQDAKDSLEKIIGGWEPSQTDIDRYASAIEKVAVKDYIGRNFEEGTEVSDKLKNEIERFGEVFNNAYENFYNKSSMA